MSDSNTSRPVSPASFIRKHIFGCRSQEEFGHLIGYTQVSVCRWENGLQIARDAQESIRNAASARGIKWDNNWFFEVPAWYAAGASGPPASVPAAGEQPLQATA